MGCRGCAGTTGRTSCGTPAAANVSLCGHDSVLSTRCSRDVSKPAEVLRSKASPAAQQTGGHRREATREQATQRARKSSVWVPRPRRRRGAQALCNSAFTQPVAVGGC